MIYRAIILAAMAALYALTRDDNQGLQQFAVQSITQRTVQ